MPSKPRKEATFKYHRFLDEAGDTTFFGKRRTNILGTAGVSSIFALGMVSIKQDLETTRNQVAKLVKKVSTDPYLCSIPSVRKRIHNGGFYFHAKDDPPEVRYIFFEFLRDELPFSLEAYVGRKIPGLYARKHNNNEHEFYADLLHHLLKNKMGYEKLVLNVAERGNSTRMANLEAAAENARRKFTSKTGKDANECKIVFNIQSQRADPLLAVPDYSLWAVQRVFEKGETRFYGSLNEAGKIPTVVDLYDFEKINDVSKKWGNYYGPKNPLTAENKIGPPSS